MPRTDSPCRTSSFAHILSHSPGHHEPWPDLGYAEMQQAGAALRAIANVMDVGQVIPVAFTAPILGSSPPGGFIIRFESLNRTSSIWTGARTIRENRSPVLNANLFFEHGAAQSHIRASGTSE